MSGNLSKSTNDHLLKLQCHFTWNLLAEDVDINDVEKRLNDQIVFLSDAYKHRLYNLLAYLKHLKGNQDEAILQLQKAEAQIQESNISEDTDFRKTVMYGNFAWVFYHQNKISESCTYAKKVESILKKYESPPMQKTLLVDIYGEQGWSYLSYRGKYYQRAVECFERALELDSEDPELNSGHAMAVYRIEGFDFHMSANKSFPLLEKAVTLNPTDTVLKTLLALRYLNIKKNNQGAILIEQALQEQPESPYVLRYVATFYNQNGQIEKAIEVLNKVVSLTPNSSAVYFQLAKCYKKLIRIPRTSQGHSTQWYVQQNSEAILNAIIHSKKVIELNNAHVGAHILLADIYIKTNDYQKAEEEFGEALSINNTRCEQKHEVHLNFAQFLWDCRKLECEAIKHFKETIKIQCPTWYREAAIKKLKTIAESMIDQNPKNATGYALLGFIHLQTAMKYYKTALLLEPDNQEYSEACSLLQDIYHE
ncbi:interferon-induced protein with tetratricopeptide repeats 5-like [Pyxicephalus adspersus]